MERKISAILVADMVGYSRLMELDEVGTLNLQKRHLAEVFSPLFETHHGRLVKTTGDGLLAAFSSVVEAVGCAVEVQREMAQRETTADRDRRITYRIGINLGDVIHDQGDVFGDGVNIAARLEQLADPGGICISGSAFDHLRSTVEAGYQDMGEVRIKNISRVVRAWRVLLDPDKAGQIFSADPAISAVVPQQPSIWLEQEHTTLANALEDLKESNRDQLEAIANRFEVPNVIEMSDRKLRMAIFKKAEDFRRYREVVQSIDEKSSALAHLKERALEAIDALDFDLVEDLLAQVMEVEIETAAQTAELRAQNALLLGRLDQAFVLLSSAADSLASIDPIEPSRRRITYEGWFARHAERFGGHGLEHAERLSRAALEGLDGGDTMLLWRAHIGLGISLSNQGWLTSHPKDLALLSAAADRYQVAAQCITEEDFPIQLATTQNNLAVVLMKMARRSREEEAQVFIDQAIDLLEKALQVHTREALPLKWAMAKDNLGNALDFKGVLNGASPDDGSFQFAIHAHEEALTVRRRESYPLLWAYTKGNLGLDWSNLSIQDYASDPALYRKNAEANFLEALEVLTPETEPFQYARTLANLAQLYERRLEANDCNDSGELRNLIVDYLQTIQVLFHECDSEENVRLTTEALERFQATPS